MQPTEPHEIEIRYSTSDGIWVCPARRREGAGGGARGAANQRVHCQPHVLAVDPQPPRPAAAPQPVGQRAPLGGAGSRPAAHHALMCWCLAAARLSLLPPVALAAKGRRQLLWDRTASCQKLSISTHADAHAAVHPHPGIPVAGGPHSTRNGGAPPPPHCHRSAEPTGVQSCPSQQELDAHNVS